MSFHKITATNRRAAKRYSTFSEMQRYIFILSILMSNLSFGQNSKDQTETYINKFRKELTRNHIYDFFVVKHIQYGGIRITNINDKDYCEKDEVHYRMYAFWKENNDYWLKVFDNCGGFFPMKLKDKKALESYIQNFERIKLETVERYKLKVDSVANGKKYSFHSTQSHSPLRFFWFYKNSIDLKKKIDKYNLNTSEINPNINYETNNNLELVKLNKICDVIIDEYVKTENLVREN